MRRLLALVLLLPLLVTLPGGQSAAQTGPPPPGEPRRVAGDDRIGTAIAVAQDGWDTSADVLLASAAAFPDALAGAAVAASIDAPILLTDPDELSAGVGDEIDRLGATTVTIIGGTAAVSAAVVAELEADGHFVGRIAGDDRYETAAAAALSAGAPGGAVALATGEDFADAVAAGALAAVPARVPTLLTRPGDLPGVTADAIQQLAPSIVYVVGGTAAIDVAPAAQAGEAAGARVVRLGGAERYETAVLVASEALTYTTNAERPLVVATGAAFPDALTAAPLAARRGGLLLLNPGEAIPARTATLVEDAGELLHETIGVGGSVALSEEVISALAALTTRTIPARTPTATGSGGAAATVDPLATQTAVDVLASGGNAVDATIAAAGVLGVVEPFSCGIGGGGFMVAYDAASGEVATYDSREEAPAGYDSEVFLDDNGEPLPFDERVISGLGVGVPGTVSGWQAALDDYGSRAMGELLEPAIALARFGFPLDATLSDQIAGNEEKFATFAPTADLYLRGGPRPAGSWFRNADLATTYETLAAEGAQSFYEGRIAEAVVAAATSPPIVEGTTRLVRPSPMTVDDLAGYETIRRAPVVAEYRDVTYYGMGLPSSGGLTIALALNQLERFDLGAVPREEALHLYLESIHRAWADRNAYMGDPAFFDAPVVGLLSQDYADDRSADIGPEASTDPPVPAGDPYAYQDEPGPPSLTAHTDEVTLLRDGQTTHLTVSDAAGNVVAYTFTIEQIGGSGIVVPGYGFLLNNELTDFNPVPPHPNAPDAGKRPRSSISPSIILRDGQPLVALGTPGGATIITTVLQAAINVVDFDLRIDEAIAAPRIANLNSATSNAETAFLSTPEAAALMARGHTFADAGEIGAATGIQFLPDGSVIAAAEPERRGVGSAAALP